MTRRLAFAAVAAALLAAGCGGGGDEQPTLAELEKKFICPTCQTTLELSNAPVADRMRDFIRARLAAGDSEEEIEEALVAQFGEAVLASPPKEGFNLLAWVLPLAGGAIAIAAVAVALRRWSRSRPGAAAPAAGGPPLDPELERRVDEELARFDG
ncbi:MAG TPA: cytochrome c-type biogenesis protein CcmH [Gaiellaceae bacterium]|nr:cytochrome c-type biogenesis protein CcmH [Gaiellaceae bacterium]